MPRDESFYEQRMAEIEQAARDRRDRFAAAALTGLLVNARAYITDSKNEVATAVELADLLIAALDRAQP